MQFSIVFLVLALAVANSWAGNIPAPPVGAQKQLVCYYDSSSFIKEGKCFEKNSSRKIYWSLQIQHEVITQFLEEIIIFTKWQKFRENKNIDNLNIICSMLINWTNIRFHLPWKNAYVCVRSRNTIKMLIIEWPIPMTKQM